MPDAEDRDDRFDAEVEAFLRGSDIGQVFVQRLGEFISQEVGPLLETAALASLEAFPGVVRSVAALFRQAADDIERAIEKGF